jgi:membrane associated rhomboid family serine protease
MLTLWFIGAYLESSRGPGWLLRVYFYSAVGGAVFGSLLSLTGLLHSSPSASTIGSDGALFGVLAAFAVLFGDLEMYMFPLPVAIKARYLVMVYMLLDLAFLLAGGPALGYFIIFGGAAIGFFYARNGYVRRRNRKLEEYWFDLRNAYYRWKRRRAARKFQVYMKKRDREVNFDQQGRYIAPDEPKDPTDRKWMN